MQREFPILEFDPTRRAIIEPGGERPLAESARCDVSRFQNVDDERAVSRNGGQSAAEKIGRMSDGRDGSTAFFALAQFREVTFGQMLYGGSDVSGGEWGSRGWHTRAEIRESLFWLTTEACLEL